MMTLRGHLSPGYVIIILVVSVYKTDGLSKAVSHSCYADATDADKMNLQVRILKNDDPIFEVYSFDAATGDTSLSVNRVSDTACVKDITGVTDAYTTPIEYDLTVTTTDSVHSCGIDVTTVSGVTFVKFLFRVYAYSATILSADDDPYMASCRMDDLNGVSVSTGGVDLSSAVTVILQQPQSGAYLRIRYSNDSSPVAVAKVGDEVYLSVEFFPELQLGPDNYGSHFFLGFLGVDPVSGSTASTLFIVVYPRYTLRTDITVTTTYGSETINITDGSPLKIILPSELMGCADDGVSETDEKGVEVQSYDMEIGVLVCNEETDTADCYTALPVDVTSTEYYTTSMLAANEASEFMIIAQEDGTNIDITVPGSSTHVITHDSGKTKSGKTLTVALNARETFHLAQTLSDPSLSHMNGYHITSDKSVSVISGNRNYASDHLAEQIPPITKFGTHHILIPVDLSSDGRSTTYIVQAVLAGDTIVTRYLSSSTSDVHTITTTDYPPLLIDVASDAPCELVSDQPVMVTQVVNAPVATGFEPAMVMMPSVMQWAPEYIIYHPDYSMALLTVFKSADHVQYYRVNNFTLTPATIDVNGPNGFVFGTATTLGTMDEPFEIKLTRTTIFATFMVLGYASQTSVGTAFQPFGYILADHNHCEEVGRKGDKLNNDCDDLIDEELFNGIDDDGDGVIDEDVYLSIISEYASIVAIRPVSCKVSGENTFPVGDNTIDMTDANGCVVSSAGTDVFLPSSEFTAQSGSNIGTGTKPKYLYSGYFDIAMFIDKPKLYFMCDISEQCPSSTDTRCTTICDSVGRRRRDDETQAPTNISSDIWVFPYDIQSTVKEIYRDASVQSCMDNTNVQVISGLMGVTTVISFFTATCFCCLFRRRNNRDKERERNIYNGRSTKLF